jgi:regulator of protease activity HflC (stomatin/prohibitin superfamily)
MGRRSNKFMWIGGTAVVLIALFFAFCFRIVPTGHTAVIKTFGRVEDYTLQPGAHIKSPFQSIVLMDNREQRRDFEFLAFSSDIQEVRIAGSMNYNIDKATAMRLYRDVGENYLETLIIPRLLENVKGVFAHYKAAGLIENRAELSDIVLKAMRDDIKEYSINIIGVAIHDIDFTDSYTDAVEAKQVAEQTRLKAAIEQDQLTKEAEQKAKRDIIQADAELEKTKKNADAEAYAITKKAEAEAEANKKVSASITQELIDYHEVQRWDGKRVIELNGGSVVPVLNLQEQKPSEQ